MSAPSTEASGRAGWLRYAAAVLCVAVAALIRWALQPMVGSTVPLTTFYPAIAVAAWQGGLGPGLLATALGGLAGTALFTRPAADQWPAEAVRLGLFVTIGALISLLVERLHAARRRAEASARQARDAEQSLRQGNAQLRAIFEGALDAMVIADDQGRYVDANPAACALFGVEREELLRCGLADFAAPGVDVALAWREFLRAGQATGEWRIQRRDGRLCDVGFSATAHFQPGRHISVMRDITERRRAEQALRFLASASRMLASSLEEKQNLQELARLAVPEVADWCAVDVMAPEGGLQRMAMAVADPAKAELAWELSRRYPPDVTARTGSAHVVRTGEPELYHEVADEMLVAAARDPEHLRLLREAGLRSTMVVPLATRDRILGAIWFASAGSGRLFGPADLALARELADRVAVALDNARLYREAQEANRLKDEFLATLSHELRTPLNAIVGWTHMLRAGGLDGATTARALETIDRNAKLQSQLISDILDVSRIVSGKMRLDRRPVDVAEVVQAALETVWPTAEARGVRLKPALECGEGRVLGDGDRLQQVAWNLLSNAIKFTPRGGSILVRLERAGSQVVLTVQDTGTGIAAEFLPHVFERFRQADASSTRPHGGLGLGLAIVRHLVEAHGGTIEASSPGPGQGATFTVRLPALAVLPAGEPATPATLGASWDLAGVRVLVVDDDADARDLISTILSRYGATAVCVASAAEGLALVEGATRPDVILSDIEMPGEDGYSLLRRVRALPAERGGMVPAAALTAYARAEDRVQAFMAGFQLHLAKPVDPLELGAVVSQLVRGRA